MTPRRMRPPDPEEQRKLFRRMEWVFVYAPPLLILFIGGSGAALLAWLIPFAGLGFWTKWLLIFVLVTGIPLIAYVVRERLKR